MAKLENLKSWDDFGLPEDEIVDPKQIIKQADEEKEEENEEEGEDDDDDDDDVNEEDKEENGLDQKTIEKIYSFLDSIAKGGDLHKVAKNIGVYLKNFSSTDASKAESYLEKKKDKK